MATARAAAAAGTVMALSMGSTRLLEDVAAVEAARLWFQPYLFDDDASLQGYLTGPIVAQLKNSPVMSDMSARTYDVLTGPTAITRGPV